MRFHRDLPPWSTSVLMLAGWRGVPRLPADKITLVEDWILAGALDD